jgi:1-acyl-sn-glycerol-3-phosphate acyltransferase
MLLRAYAGLVHKIFYKSFVVKGLENIPKDGAIIFAPNHQNALMDALAFVFTVPGQVVFMARADIFRKPLLAKILRFLKIMPVYRIRDGYSNLSKNEEQFNEALEVLMTNNPFCIMPEGTQSEMHRLMPLVKGIFRLAFAAKQKNPEMPVWVVPVGLDYSSWVSYKSDKIFQIGKPIEATPFYNEYLQNQAGGINAFRETLTSALKPLMVNIECGEHYATVNMLRSLLRPRLMYKLGYSKNDTFNRFLTDKWFAEHCNNLFVKDNEIFNKIEAEFEQLEEELIKLEMPVSALPEKTPSLLKLLGQLIIMVLASPVFIIGYLVHILPVRLPRIINNNAKDENFKSSIKYVIALLFFPIWYLLLFILLTTFSESLFMGILIIAAIALCGELSYRYYCLWESFRKNYQFRKNWARLGEARNLVSSIETMLQL